jgi:hypothetical protein
MKILRKFSWKAWNYFAWILKLVNEHKNLIIEHKKTPTIICKNQLFGYKPLNNY